MKVDIVEDLLRYLKNPDVVRSQDDPAWVLATDLALLYGDAECVSGLLCSVLLPLSCAERLAAHKKATPEALAVFLCRPDLPPDVLLGFVRTERRSAALQPVAKTQGLPVEVYSLLAKSRAVSVWSALISNPSVPAAAKLAVFALFVKRFMSLDDHDRRVLQALLDDPALHQPAFDLAVKSWKPDRLLWVCSSWSNLRHDQVDVLLTIAEDMLHLPRADSVRPAQVDRAMCAMASQPYLTDSILDRLEPIAMLLLAAGRDVCAEMVATARGYPAAAQADKVLRSAGRSELVDAITAGGINTQAQIVAVSENPVFDRDLACRLVASLPALHDVFDDCSIADRFVGAAVASPADLMHVLMSGSWSHENMNWLAADTTQRVFTGASPEELIEALTVARSRPAWRRFVELAAAAHSPTALTDEVVAHFGWSGNDPGSSHTTFVGVYVTLVREHVWNFLLGRLGTGPAVWAAFMSIVDRSVPLGATADLAVLADPPEQQ